MRVAAFVEVQIGVTEWGHDSRFDTVEAGKPEAVERLRRRIATLGASSKVDESNRWIGSLPMAPDPERAERLTVDDITFTTYRHGGVVILQAFHAWEVEL